MLRGELTTGAGRHANHDRNVELSTRHVPQSRRIVHDLVECEQTEVHRHHLDDGPHAVECRTDARTHEGGLGERRVAYAFLAEFLEQPFAHGVTAPVATHVLAHQEHALVAQQSLPQTLAQCVAIGGAYRAGHPCAPLTTRRSRA